VLAAIGITTAMDAHGLSAFSALPLLPLTALAWILERHSREEMGIAWGGPRDYAIAVMYPAIVLGTLVAIAWAAGATQAGAIAWDKVVRDFAIMAGATIAVAFLTEEGFFRGWLMASLSGHGLGRWRTLALSSVAFSLWHVSAVVLDTGFDLVAAQIPVYLLNAAAIGAVWGALRMQSGSVVVASVSHGLWNGGAYVLFGYGHEAGALGIADTAVFGPENGWLGLAVNLLFLAVLLGRLQFFSAFRPST
jgi:membrane protease YdiL (CAAX protease family)